MSWRSVEQRARIRRHGAVGARGTEAAAGLGNDRLRREAEAAIAGYTGTTKRCPVRAVPSRRGGERIATVQTRKSLLAPFCFLKVKQPASSENTYLFAIDR
jgi:hypothetical protein